jgi:ADP-ribose pyrophosphatase
MSDQTSANVSSANSAPANIVWRGRHLSVADREGWEFVTRNTNRPAVGILALTADGKVVLVEQFRRPVECSLVELPAGLSGDTPGAEHESLLAAAQRELLEETGYSAERWTELIGVFSSPGLTDERLVLFLAEGLAKTGDGAGDGSEQITLHEVPLDGVMPWLLQRGQPADMKLLAALYAAEKHLRLPGR